MDVAYLIDACWSFTDGEPEEQLARLRLAVSDDGKHRHLGIHQYPAQLALCEPAAWTTDPIDNGRTDLGWMLYDLNGARHARARFFRAALIDGVLDLRDRIDDSALFS